MSGLISPVRVLLGLFLTFVIMQRRVGIIILVESRPSGIVTVLELTVRGVELITED